MLGPAELKQAGHGHESACCRAAVCRACNIYFAAATGALFVGFDMEGKQSCRVHSLMHSVPDWSRSCTRYNTTECHIASSNADACRAGRTTSLELSEVHASTCIHIRLAYFSQGKYN